MTSTFLCVFFITGVQGALLSKFMEPLFISSVTLSDLYEPKHLSRALCCRMPLADGSKQVPAYVVNHPEFYFGNIVDAKRVMETEATKKTKSWSLYWSRDQLGKLKYFTTCKNFTCHVL